jgi:hypothetical protein
MAKAEPKLVEPNDIKPPTVASMKGVIVHSFPAGVSQLRLLE